MWKVDDSSIEFQASKSDETIAGLLFRYTHLLGDSIRRAELQRRFRALGAFAENGSFDEAAVAAVWAADDLHDAHNALMELVALGLVELARSSFGTAAEANSAVRYTLNGPLHAYTRALLLETDEQADARARHAAHYLAAMREADEGGHFPTMRADLPQILAALAWAGEAGALKMLLALLGESANLLAQFGAARERAAAAERAVALADERGEPETVARALGTRANAYSDLATVQGEDRGARLRQALADAVQAVALFAAVQHPVYLEIGARVLRGIRDEIVRAFGAEAFAAWWAEITGGQPIPEWLAAAPVVPPPEEGQRLANLLAAWMQTPDWASSEQYITEHQGDLLTDAAEAVMGMLVEANPGNEMVEQHAALLRRCRAVGVAAAYGGGATDENG